MIIAGSRDFNNYKYLDKKVTHIIEDIKKSHPDIKSFTVISGTAKGADRLGEKYASINNIRIERFPAEWDKYGKRAGPLRNIEMAEYATEDGAYGFLIAFWDGFSKGTRHMINTAKRHGLDVCICNQNLEESYNFELPWF